MQKIIIKSGALLAVCALVKAALAAKFDEELNPLLDSIVVDRGDIKEDFCIYDLPEDVQNVIFGKIDCDEEAGDDVQNVIVGDVDYDEESSDGDQNVIVEYDDSDGKDSDEDEDEEVGSEDADSNGKYSILPLMLASKQMFWNVNRYLLKRLLIEKTFTFSRFMMESGAYRMALLEDVAALPLSSYRYTKNLSFSERRRVLQLLRFLGYGRYATVPHVTRPISLIIKVFLATTEGRTFLALILFSMLWAAGAGCALPYLYSLEFVQWRVALTSFFAVFSLSSVLILSMTLFELFDFADIHVCMPEKDRPKVDDDRPLRKPGWMSCVCRC